MRRLTVVQDSGGSDGVLLVEGTPPDGLLAGYDPETLERRWLLTGSFTLVPESATPDTIVAYAEVPGHDPGCVEVSLETGQVIRETSKPTSTDGWQCSRDRILRVSWPPMHVSSMSWDGETQWSVQVSGPPVLPAAVVDLGVDAGVALVSCTDVTMLGPGGSVIASYAIPASGSLSSLFGETGCTVQDAVPMLNGHVLMILAGPSGYQMVELAQRGVVRTADLRGLTPLVYYPLSRSPSGEIEISAICSDGFTYGVIGGGLLVATPLGVIVATPPTAAGIQQATVTQGSDAFYIAVRNDQEMALGRLQPE